MTLTIGAWYLDEELGRAFKVLAFDAETVSVVDEMAERRTVNRLMFEAQMSRHEHGGEA